MSDHHIDNGGYVHEKAISSTFRVRGDDYLKFYIRKSPVSIEIQRSYRKVDDTLSYIGGLFSFVLMFFSFINLYN